MPLAALVGTVHLSFIMGLKPTVFAAALFLVFAPAGPLWAQTSGFSQADRMSLDALYDRLAASTDETSARLTADEVWKIWTAPADPVLAARMDEIIKAGGFAGPMSQMPLIEQLIEDYPDYSEGYNMRATAHFLRGAYEASLADIEKVLALEPRHFGALSGKALIYHTQGKRDAALEAMKAALDIHPFLGERSLFPELGPPPIRS
jgi:hypothetical protein